VHTTQSMSSTKNANMPAFWSCSKEVQMGSGTAFCHGARERFISKFLGDDLLFSQVNSHAGTAASGARLRRPPLESSTDFMYGSLFNVLCFTNHVRIKLKNARASLWQMRPARRCMRCDFQYRRNHLAGPCSGASCSMHAYGMACRMRPPWRLVIRARNRPSECTCTNKIFAKYVWFSM